MTADPRTDGRIEAVKLAHDSTKQILTISTAVITAIVGVVLVSKIQSPSAAGLAAAAAFALVFSNVCGLFALFGLAGILEDGGHIYCEAKPNRVLMDSHYKVFGRLQLFFFASGTLIMFLSVFVALAI